MTEHDITRRTVLRGLGVTMALPWMESTRVWGDVAKSAKKASEAPTRMAILFAGCGFYKNEWWAKGEGKDMQLGKVLAPLNDFRENMVFIRGLYNKEALKGNIHSSQTGNLLSGAPLASGGRIQSGTSVDQYVAQRIGHQTKIPSLVLGCEKSNAGVHKNYSLLYSSHISWSSPNTPTPLEVYPALAFDRLFNNEAQVGDRSVLDAVLGDAKDLRNNVSRLDQQKLDEYLNSVREVERRIQATVAARVSDAQGTADKETSEFIAAPTPEPTLAPTAPPTTVPTPTSTAMPTPTLAPTPKPTATRIPPTPTPTRPPPTPTVAKPVTIAQWSGSTIKNTETFNVPTQQWKIAWDTRPGEYGDMNFQIYVYNRDGSPHLSSYIVANVIGANNDSTIMRGSGDFYLTINTAQPYDITVTTVP